MHHCKLTPTANLIGWGGRCFKPRFLFFFFFFGQEVGSGAMASPSSVCLGCISVCSLFCPPSFCLSCPPSFCLSCVRFSCLLVSDVFVLLSSSCCRRCAVSFFLVCCLVLLPLAIAHVVGGVSFAWVVMYVAVSVSSLLLRLASKKAREVPPCACFACFFFSLSRPLASCPCGSFMLCLFVFDARARAATASPRIRLYSFLRRSLAVSRHPTFWP